jgi:hypothetical protein
MLLARIYEALPPSCPICHSQMRIIAFINDASTPWDSSAQPAPEIEFDQRIAW